MKKSPEKNHENGLKPARRRPRTAVRTHGTAVRGRTVSRTAVRETVRPCWDLRVLQHGRAVFMHGCVSLAASRWLFRGSI